MDHFSASGKGGVTAVGIGFAADAHGNGVCYVRMGGSAGQVLRVPFSVKRCPALCEREVGYAALQSALTALRRLGPHRIRVVVDDARLAGDLRERRDVPAALGLAYVKLRCALNQFHEYAIDGSSKSARDLTARARSEIAMQAAA